ncbi:MAG: thioesterase family protein [Pseudomonadota bacterium]
MSSDSTSAAAHDFDAAIALASIGDNEAQGQTHPAYGNMVGPFGGVIAATLLNAVMRHPDLLGEPVSQTVHFAAPIADGGFTVQTRVMRTNRTTQHWHVELIQNGEVAAFATAVTAVRRETWAALDASFPEVPPASSIAPSPHIARAAWTGRYEMRFIDGAPGAPDTHSDSSQSTMWIRDTPERALDYLSLAALCDAFYPRIFVRRPKWVPIGTVALTTFFHADARQLAAQGSAPLLGVARAQRFGNGFFDQSAEMWNERGELLATSHQVVYFKE